jgi:glycosyltransferase involved in cell wall biosynthesis
VTALHVVVPAGIDDPSLPSGGNTYDRRVCETLKAGGWTVGLHPVTGSWPAPEASASAALAAVIRLIPDGAVVLLDGLVASTAPEVLAPHAGRLRMIALVHMPLGQGTADAEVRKRECAALSAAVSIVATSGWSRRFLLREYSLPESRVHVAEPGVDAAALAPGTGDGAALLCVGALVPGKGQDVLLDSLAHLADLSWRCLFLGSPDRDPEFAGSVRRRAVDTELGDRVRFAGPVAGADLDRSYAAADLLVLPSRAETYGMVVTEALARGLPVVASEVGGVPEALGRGAGRRPGLLVPPGGAGALAAALRSWLTDPRMREQLRLSARARRSSLPEWSTTASVIADVVSRAAR